MIISRTPLRVSFVGGGTDSPAFYAAHAGAVVSAAINRYIYVLVNPKFDGRFRVSYSRTENVDSIDEIQHDIVKECLKLFDVKGLEVVSVSDIPGEGSGLGSSSVFTVGLLRALYSHCGYTALPKVLAEHAFAVESGACGHPCGKQDAYAAAYGGIHYYEFHKDLIGVESFALTPVEMESLSSRVMLFWTGMRRDGQSNAILKDQNERLAHGHPAEDTGMAMAELARLLRDELKKREFDRVGKYVKASWTLKRRFSDDITNEQINQLVDEAINAGAEGAKICGAGGGGFLLVLAAPAFHGAIEKSLGLRRVLVKIGAKGSTVIFASAG